MNEDRQFIDELAGMETLGNGQSDLSAHAYNSIGGQSDNLVVFQLELDNILEKIEHMLRGDILQNDGEGGVDWVKPEDNNLVMLNDYGTQLVMSIISSYLNRNTILSFYDEDRIYEIVFNLGNELADLIYINYEKMGLDTVEKQSRYPLLVMNTLHMVESSYRRALQGNELESLRTARVVQQSQPLGQHNVMPQQKKSFSLNPFRRFTGG